ncbi:MAG: 5'/3'-nucleotidase SurE, partial [Bacteroidia bacterium]|nr:5'/3'-nucleotidase SurE [Bacteroidia bacterium]
AIDKVLKRKPDLMVSGVNHGANSSINVIYSGTMSAALEAAIEGVQSIGFSLCNYNHEADFEPAKHFIKKIAESILNKPMPHGTLLNVNIPVPEDGIIKGIKVCRQAKAKYGEHFEERTDPFGIKYYWMTGKFFNLDDAADNDLSALSEGYISVVPTQFDLTSYSTLNDLKVQLDS